MMFFGLMLFAVRLYRRLCRLETNDTFGWTETIFKNRSMTYFQQMKEVEKWPLIDDDEREKNGKRMNFFRNS